MLKLFKVYKFKNLEMVKNEIKFIFELVSRKWLTILMQF